MAKPTPGNPGEPDLPQWLPRSAFPFLIRFADIGGKRIHYVDEGSGPALLLVSAGQWSFMFRDVIVRLRKQFRCLTFDFPGGGLSPDEPGYDHSLEANARILRRCSGSACRRSGRSGSGRGRLTRAASTAGHAPLLSSGWSLPSAGLLPGIELRPQ